MLSGGVDADAGANVPARIVLNHTGWRLGWIKADGLDVVLNINIFIGSNAPAKRPIDREVIPYIDIVIHHDGDLAKTRA